MSRSLRRRRGGVASTSVAVLAAACASGPPAAAGDPHFAAETVTVSEQGLLPAADVRIPVFAVVVFRNALANGAIEVEVERPFGTCSGCSTTLNFTAAGDCVVSRSIAPQDIAALCFHDPGVFAFTVRAPGTERKGRILVGGGR